MLTLITTPKPFEGHFDLIQRNAIASWTMLEPACEVILFGDEAGAAQAAADLGVRHVPEVARNEFGTPLLDDMFERAKAMAAHDLIAYVNADIILLSDFMEAVRRVAALERRFLMVGQRRNIDIVEPLSFDPNWERRIRDLVERSGAFYAGIDYFVFPKNLWAKVPPFAIGRLYWDNWPLYAARLRRAKVIDATPVVLAAHQNHVYSASVMNGPEPPRNWELLGGVSRLFTTHEATHALTSRGLLMRCRSCYPMCVCGPERACG